MISYEAYKVLHLLAILVLFLSFGGLALYVAGGGSRQAHPNRKLIAGLHGVAAFLVLLGGFGLLARLGIVQTGFPLWVWVKLGVWVLLSLVVLLPYRRPALARPLFLLYAALGGVAAWAAVYKPE